MLDLVDPSQPDRAAALFHRDGFVVVANALTDAQFAYLKAGVHRVVAQQTVAIPLEVVNLRV